MRSLSWRNFWWAIFIVGVGLRLIGLNTFNLWYDEAGTSWMSSLPFARMIAATAGDVHPPLYFLIEWVIVHLAGPQAWAVRLPSAVAGILALYVARRLGERLHLEPAAILAGTGLMAVNPFQLFFAQDARMYSLLQLLFLAGVLAALGRRWVLLGLCILAMLYTHNYGVIYSVPLNVLALAQIWRARLPSIRSLWPGLARWGLMNGIAFGSYAPWALVVMRQMNSFATGHWLYWVRPVTPGNFAYPFYTFMWMFALPQWAQAAGAVVGFGLLWFAIAKVIRVRHAGAAVLAFLTLAVPILAAVASLVWSPIYLFRALIGSSVPLYFLMGWAMTAGVNKWTRVWAGAMLAPVVLAALLNYPATTAQQKSGSREFAEYVTQRWQAGDVIYHASMGTLMEFWPYAADKPAYLMPGDPGSLGGLTPQTRQAMGMQEVPIDAVQWRRAWLVWISGPMTSKYVDDGAAAILAAYPHEQVLTAGDGKTIQGGVWLLWH